MVTTTVINHSGSGVEIKEGNAGVYSMVGVVADGDSRSLTINPQATYREYWCAQAPNDTGGNVILASDDCETNEVVEIYMKGGKLAWRPIKPRGSGHLPTDEKFRGIFGRMWGFLRKPFKAPPENTSSAATENTSSAATENTSSAPPENTSSAPPVNPSSS